MRDLKATRNIQNAYRDGITGERDKAYIMFRVCLFLMTLVAAVSGLEILLIGVSALVPFSLFCMSGDAFSIEDDEDEYWEKWKCEREERRKARALRRRQNSQIIAQYRQGIDLDEIALATGRSVPSVRGILVSRYLYKKIDGERRIAVARTNASQEIIKFDFQAGQAVSREELVNKLSAQGYERVNRISAQGQFAVLGGIIDIHQWGEIEAYDWISLETR